MAQARKLVASGGMSLAQIARTVGLHENTLRRHGLTAASIAADGLADVPSLRPLVRPGTPLLPKQEDDLRSLVAETDRTGVSITSEDVMTVLLGHDQDGLSLAAQLGSPRPSPPPRPPLETLIEMNSTYGGSEYSRMLLSMPEEEIDEELKSEDRYLANDWIEQNQALAAARLGNAQIDTQGDASALVAWGCDDLYYGSLIRAFASLESDTPLRRRPSKEQVLALCAQNEELEQMCLNVLHDNLPPFSALRYDRLCDEIQNTEVIYGLEREAQGHPNDLPADYEMFN